MEQTRLEYESEIELTWQDWMYTDTKKEASTY